MKIFRHHKTPNAIGIALGVYNGLFLGHYFPRFLPFGDSKDPMEPYI